MSAAKRLAAVRAFMVEQAVDALVVPTSDPHGSEYVASHWQTRAWCSGFSGSAGTLVVTHERAALWTDGRYLLRATAELEGSGIDLQVASPPWAPYIAVWLGDALPHGASVGYDPAVHSDCDAAALERSLRGTRLTLRAVDDPASAIRTDRPPLPTEQLVTLEDAIAGEPRTAKLGRIRERLRRMNADAHLVTALDDVAWTLNVRGGDVPMHPVTIAYLVMTLADARLCVAPGKVTPDLRRALQADGVTVHPYDDVLDVVAGLPGDATVVLDPATTNRRLRDALPAACTVVAAPSIAGELKAIKNPTELAGIREAFAHDGVSLVTLLHELDTTTPAHGWTEIGVAERLEAIRGREAGYRGPSFPTIVGYRANSAVGHYRPHPETSPALRPDGILLVDAGAHYSGGTTDVTRTITLGGPTDEERRVYTTVLRSLFRLTTVTFPRGAAGRQLDALAREPLWRQGWECRHGIGHGIGHLLNVHEGPQRFAPDSGVGLLPGMVTTCEPGTYFAGRFGVRLENALLAVPHADTPFGPFCAFETLTLCPFDRRLVDTTLLDADEVAWLDAYHQLVYEALGASLEGEVRAWLRSATRPM